MSLVCISCRNYSNPTPFFHQVQLRFEGFVVEVWTADQQIVGHILYEGPLVGGHIFRSHVQEAYQRVACQDMLPGTPSG